MIKNMCTIEDLLELSAGFKEQAKFQLESSDTTIMQSVARQVFKGTALTDRQYAVMQEKLSKYKDQFTLLGVNFDLAVNSVRQPLRQIDRSKYIKLRDNQIVIRFPFRKTDIMSIQEFSNNAEGYSHQKGSHEHVFSYTEANLLNILNRFSHKEFEIDEELVEVYNLCKDIHSSPNTHLSGINDGKLININQALLPFINSELNTLSNDTVLQYVDRKFRYGFNLVNVNISDENSLIKKIAFRKDKSYHSNPNNETLDSLLSALWSLNRFPMLVLLDELSAEHQLHELINYFRDILPSNEQSVLFRLDNPESGFNQLIKDRKLNNWVDKNTKIVYINKNKLPKLLIKSEWKPTVAFSYNSRFDRLVDSYIGFNCDLIIFREELVSPFRKYSKIYG
jgi:hypothetical protein